VGLLPFFPVVFQEQAFIARTLWTAGAGGIEPRASCAPVQAFGSPLVLALNWLVNTIQDEDHKALLQRPVEEDTDILSVHFRRVAGIPILIERWSWRFESLRGSSAVFLNQHVAGIDDGDLQKFLTEEAGVNLAGGVTIARREMFTYVNFAFESQ
jgi:hypothetical protein